MKRIPLQLNTFFAFLFFTALAGSSNSQNQPPQISNVSAVTVENEGTVTITYDLSDAENDDAEVWVKASLNGGFTFLENVDSVSGDIGYPVSPGTGKQITWNFRDTISDILNCTVKLVADDRMIDIQQVVDQVDSMNLKGDVQKLEGIRHASAGLTKLENTKDTLEQRFQQAGLQTNRQSFNNGTYTAHNITGRLAGQTGEKNTFIIDAHFDGVHNSPAADDNASGVAGVLEAARILSQYNFNHSVKFIGFDQEETGLDGSAAYVSSGIESYETIEGVFNFEMIGYFSADTNSQDLPTGFDFAFPNAYNQIAADTFKGNFITNVANTASDPLKVSFDSAAAQYVPELKVVSLSVSGTGTAIPDLRRSDHASFWDGGHPALMLTDGADFRNPNYHTPGDSSETLNYTFMANVVKATIGAVCMEAGLQHSSSTTTPVQMTTGLEAKSRTANFMLYPNPAEQRVKIELDGTPGTGNLVRLVSQAGQVVRIEKVNTSRVTLNLKDVSPGVYFVELVQGEQVAKKKLVVR